MKRRSSRNRIVGLDIGSSSVKAVELQGKPAALSLASLGSAPLQPDTVVDRQIMELNDMSNVIASIFHNQQIKTDRVATGVSGFFVIVKNIFVPQMSREELEESIEWHAEEHIPYDISDVSLEDGQEIKATLAGRDAGTDLAVLRVEGDNLGADKPSPQVPDASMLTVGDFVLAVGRAHPERGVSARASSAQRATDGAYGAAVK